MSEDPKRKKPRIVLVEDDLALAKAYREHLEAQDFDVHLCSDGQEVLAQALEYRPDLILLDIMMTEISGFDVLDILRNTKETARTKIIILTALSQASDRRRARQLGASDYLVKSQAVIDDVVKRIRHHLGLTQVAEKKES